MYGLLQGNLPNNAKFSNCSSEKIAFLIDEVVNERNGKVNCLTDSKEAFCGNGILEQGEECDCGYEEECTDVCCNPRRTGGRNNDLSCTLKIDPNTNTKYECSPAQGPCCSKECSFVAASSLICRSSTECKKEQKCSGNSASCPQSDNNADFEYCNNYSMVCWQGECSGSLCKRVGQRRGEWEECFMTVSGHLTIQKREQLCYLACKNKNDPNSRCYASNDSTDSSSPLNFLLQEVNGLRNSAGEIKLPAGSPCNNLQGYCDTFSRCITTDNDTPLQDLRDLIFTKKAQYNVQSWIYGYWWAVVLSVGGLILLIGLVVKFVKFCQAQKSRAITNQPV